MLLPASHLVRSRASPGSSTPRLGWCICPVWCTCQRVGLGYTRSLVEAAGARRCGWRRSSCTTQSGRMSPSEHSPTAHMPRRRLSTRGPEPWLGIQGPQLIRLGRPLWLLELHLGRRSTTAQLHPMHAGWTCSFRWQLYRTKRQRMKCHTTTQTSLGMCRSMRRLP